MKFSKKCRYALRALTDMAACFEDRPVVLGILAERSGTSLQCLEQVFAPLRRAGIVKGTKGYQGGYRLCAPPESISIAAVMEALDGSYWIDPEEASEDHHSQMVSASIQKQVIDPLNRQMSQLLESITLEDLKKSYLDEKNYNSNMYYI